MGRTKERNAGRKNDKLPVRSASASASSASATAQSSGSQRSNSGRSLCMAAPTLLAVCFLTVTDHVLAQKCIALLRWSILV